MSGPLDFYGTPVDEVRPLVGAVWLAVIDSSSDYSMTLGEGLIHFIGVPHIPCLKKRSPFCLNPTF